MRAILAYQKKINKYPGNPCIKIIYDGTASSSPARRLMVDFWTWQAGATWHGLDAVLEATCAEFVNDLIRALVSTRKAPTTASSPWIQNAESYCVHGKD
jgi:rhamnogalacturonyl hydrolase YesR